MAKRIQPGAVAAVDLGSNSFHMVIARVVDGQLHVVDRMRERVQLAAGLAKDGKITDEAQTRAIACLERFGQRLSGMPANRVRIVGTNALRVAKNRKGFLRRAEQVLGHEIEVIDGTEEARVLFRGVAHDLPSVQGMRLVVDIGGGSTECILGSGEEPQRADSLQMGCVVFSERFFADGKLTRERFKKATLAARIELEPVERFYREAKVVQVLGSSGTIEAIDAMCRASNGERYSGITRPLLKKLRDSMIERGSLDALNLPGLSEDRRSVIAGGLSVLHGVFKSFELVEMIPSKSALREGLLLELVGELGDDDTRERTVARMSERYAVDVAHSRRVEKTALAIARQVEVDWELDGRTARLIRWAARLHEIGQALRFSGYHRHGAYLLANTDLPGFSQFGQEYLAALVGLHRRALTEERLEALRQLDGERAVRAAAILRLAVCLNRGRQPEEVPSLFASSTAKRLELKFPKGFLDARQMTRADLEEEREALRSARIELIFE